MFRDLWHRMRALFRRGRVEGELDEELRFHLELEVEKYVRNGMGNEEAVRRAHVEFGGVELAKEECRDAAEWASSKLCGGISIMVRGSCAAIPVSPSSQY